ncbi:MAG TPA: CPBP family intramembrane glutamic endopeptidase, partial [Dehalococcoidia bacterium]
AAAVPIAGAMAAGLCFERSRPFYRDPRVIAATPAQAAWETFIRIPLATALPEEAIFRGAILGTLSRRRSRLLATAITSGLFGLWHVAPSLERLATGPGLHGGGRADRAGWVALSVLVTALAGFPLAALRYRSRSIVAPWLGHCAANGAGFAGAWLVARLAPPDGTEAGLTPSTQRRPGRGPRPWAAPARRRDRSASAG